MPSISVVMAAFNAEEYLEETLKSLLDQSFADFELIVVDDASTDGTGKILARCGDKRLRVLRNEHNGGVAFSANRGLEAAKGKYIARADADDVYAPERLRVQRDFMEANPETALCGGNLRYAGVAKGSLALPGDKERIKCHLPFYCTIMQTVSFLRADFVRKHNLRYDEGLAAASDYELWFRITHDLDAPCANLPLVLAQYRVHPASLSSSRALTQQAVAARVRRRHFEAWGISMTERREALHNMLYLNVPPETARDIAEMREWLLLLREMNALEPIYADIPWRAILARKFFDFAAKNLSLGPWALEEAVNFPDHALARIPSANVDRLRRKALEQSTG